MTSENTPERLEETETLQAPVEAGGSHVAAGAEGGTEPREAREFDGAPGPDAPETTEAPQPTALFVRRERRMNLGGWVVLALVIGAVSGLVWGMFRGVFEIAPLVIAALYGVLFVGVALALVAVVVDWVLERTRAK